MTWVMLWWVLAMVSALSWAKAYTTALTAATLAAFLWQHHAASLQWTGLLQLAAFGVTPLLLSAQRERDRRDLKRLHAEEAVALTHLSAAARSLMSLQAATQQLDAQIPASPTCIMSRSRPSARSIWPSCSWPRWTSLPACSTRRGCGSLI